MYSLITFKTSSKLKSYKDLTGFRGAIARKTDKNIINCPLGVLDFFNKNSTLDKQKNLKKQKKHFYP